MFTRDRPPEQVHLRCCWNYEYSSFIWKILVGQTDPVMVHYQNYHPYWRSPTHQLRPTLSSSGSPPLNSSSSLLQMSSPSWALDITQELVAFSFCYSHLLDQANETRYSRVTDAAIVVVTPCVGSVDLFDKSKSLVLNTLFHVTLW